MARVSIEDCLNYIENRFALVAIAAHRTRELMDGTQPLVRSKNKEAVTALREIADGLVLSDNTILTAHLNAKKDVAEITG